MLYKMDTLNCICQILFMFYIQYELVSSMETYLHHALFEVTAFNVRERAFLYKYHILEDTLVFGNSVTNEAAVPMHIAIEDEMADADFEALLQKYNFKYTRLPIRLNEYQHGRKYSADINHFMSWNDILTWINAKMTLYPVLEKKVVSYTDEKREIFYLKISENSSNLISKPAVFIMGSEQGRDWISAAVILKFVDGLLTYSPSLMHVLGLYDFYIVPISNPDGYHFSMTEDRFWAKNRKPLYSDDQECSPTVYGVNTDRNWHWEEHSMENNEGSPCNAVYLGRTMFSEQEPRAIFHMINQTANKLMAFIDVRGFSKMITVPYAHTQEPSINHDLEPVTRSYQ